MDVRAVAYDAKGNCGLPVRRASDSDLAAVTGQLFTGADGLPYNDFTCMAAGPKGIWFGTTNGAIRY